MQIDAGIPFIYRAYIEWEGNAIKTSAQSGYCYWKSCWNVDKGFFFCNLSGIHGRDNSIQWIHAVLLQKTTWIVHLSSRICICTTNLIKMSKTAIKFCNALWAEGGWKVKLIRVHATEYEICVTKYLLVWKKTQAASGNIRNNVF